MASEGQRHDPDSFLYHRPAQRAGRSGPVDRLLRSGIKSGKNPYKPYIQRARRLRYRNLRTIQGSTAHTQTSGSADRLPCHKNRQTIAQSSRTLTQTGINNQPRRDSGRCRQHHTLHNPIGRNKRYPAWQKRIHWHISQPYHACDGPGPLRHTARNGRDSTLRQRQTVDHIHPGRNHRDRNGLFPHTQHVRHPHHAGTCRNPATGARSIVQTRRITRSKHQYGHLQRLHDIQCSRWRQKLLFLELGTSGGQLIIHHARSERKPQHIGHNPHFPRRRSAFRLRGSSGVGRRFDVDQGQHIHRRRHH